MTYINTSEGGKIQIGDIDSGSAAAGTVITADGIGGADWETVGEALENVITLSTIPGTLTIDQLSQAQQNICTIKLTQSGGTYYFRKYLETSTEILFTYVVESAVSGGSIQMDRNHIKVTISSRAYELIDGELIDTYNKDQTDSNFTEVILPE